MFLFHHYTLPVLDNPPANQVQDFLKYKIQLKFIFSFLSSQNIVTSIYSHPKQPTFHLLRWNRF